MSAIYDNWERLVAAVLRKERDRQLCLADSIATSVGSLASIGSLSSIIQNADVSAMYDGITVVVQRLVRPGTDIMAPRSYFSYKDEILAIYDQHDGTKDGMYELNWGARVRIATAVAKAVANNHDSLPRINGVFSLEKTGPASIVIPTDRYRAPELNPSEASDVYSFGVLLIELLAGFKVVCRTSELVRWAVRMFQEVGTLVVFEFVPVRDPIELIQMWKMFLVAMRCVQEKPEMCDVLKMMQGLKPCPSCRRS